MKLLIGCLIVNGLCSYSVNNVETISCNENSYSDFYFESSAPVSIANRFLSNNLSIEASLSRIPVHKDDNYHKLELVKYLPKTNVKNNLIT